MSAATDQVRVVEPQVIIVPMLTVTRAVDLYLGDLTRRVYAANTIRTYRDILDRMVDRLPEDADVHEVKPDDVRRFLDLYTKNTPGTRYHVFSVLYGFFNWLYKDGKIKTQPMSRLERPRKVRPENLDVKTVSSDDVSRMLAACQTWPERLTISVLAYLGPRKHATAMLRYKDFNQRDRTIRFYEKGPKTIWKPAPDELVDTINAAFADGAIDPDGWLIPNIGPRPAGAPKHTRCDRTIYDTVIRVASRVGVDSHVHALRAAFAVFCFEQGYVRETVQELLGHEDPKTTQIYERRVNKRARMEPVRSLSWANRATPPETPQTAEKSFGEPGYVGAGGFEPP